MGIENATHLTVLDEMTKELEANFVGFNRQAEKVKSREELIELRMQQNEALTEIVHRHRRTMLFMQGKPYEPQAHSAETVLLPVGGVVG
jgi:hypothetical protein